MFQGQVVMAGILGEFAAEILFDSLHIADNTSETDGAPCWDLFQSLVQLMLWRVLLFPRGLELE